MSTLKERFAELAALNPSIKQADIAKRVGVKPPSVNGWFTGATKSLNGVTAARVAQMFGVSVQWLTTGEGPKLAPPPPRADGLIRRDWLPRHDVVEEEPVSYAGHVDESRLRKARVPVVGMARLGENGFYEEVSSAPGAGDGTVEAFSDDPAAYALRVRGDSMFPAIRDGWFVLIEPHSKIQPGEYVLIKLTNGQKMVKELIMERQDSITVVSVNGDVRRTIMREELDSHYGLQAVGSILSPSKWKP
jgi:phage repressor protein C with HTH and peptisase S24 domain